MGGALRESAADGRRAIERRIAVLYPGEMGTAVGRALAGDGWAVVTCLEGRSVRTAVAAEEAGFAVVGSLGELAEGADVVVSLVPQTAVSEVAGAFAAAISRTDRRPLYLDANSVSPETVGEVRALVEGTGCGFVDGAFLGSAKALGQRTTLYLSGGRAPELAAVFGDALACEVLGPEVGVASAFKLAFAGFNKGLVALFLEVMAAGERMGRGDELLRVVREFYPGTVETVERLLPSYPKHAGRRAEEMNELVRWLASQGQDGEMGFAARRVLTQFAALGLDAEASWSLEEVLAACAHAGFLIEGGDEV